MTIVSSVLAVNDLQDDGRRVVREIWTDDQGNQFTYDYMADVGVNPNTVMANRAADVEATSEALKVQEVAQ